MYIFLIIFVHMKLKVRQTTKLTFILTLLLLPYSTYACWGQKIRNKKEIKITELSVTDRLLKKAKSFLGTPYRSSGKSPKGFDCSGFTSWIFDKFGIDLKHSSQAQYQQGKKVRKKNIKSGDLVFFSRASRGRRIGHVGIVCKVNDNGVFKFIHASTSKGVIISSIAEQYYSRRFKGARRVVSE